MREEIWTVIKWILGLILIFVVAYLLFFGPGRIIIAKIGLLGLPKEAEETSKNNFDIVVENLERCKAITETNCLCEVFPSWPATFAKNFQLQITSDKDTQLNLVYGKKTRKNATIENLIINAQIIETKTPVWAPTKTIDWKEEPPLFVQQGLESEEIPIIGPLVKTLFGKKHYKVVSNAIYKTEHSFYLLISDKQKKDLPKLEPIINSIKNCSS